jgi:hypothetical protein
VCVWCDTNLCNYEMAHIEWVYSHLQGLVFLRRVCMSHTNNTATVRYGLSIIQWFPIWNNLICSDDWPALHCILSTLHWFLPWEGLYTFHWSTSVAGGGPGQLCHAQWGLINTLLQDGSYVGVIAVCRPLWCEVISGQVLLQSLHKLVVCLFVCCEVLSWHGYNHRIGDSWVRYPVSARTAGLGILSAWTAGLGILSQHGQLG